MAAYDPARYGRSAPVSSSSTAIANPAVRGTANSNNTTAPRSTASASATKQPLPVSAQLLGQALGYPLALGVGGHGPGSAESRFLGGGGGLTLPMPTGSLLESSSLYSVGEGEGGSVCASPMTALPTPAVVPTHPFKSAGR